jgi:hypothetical protein
MERRNLTAAENDPVVCVFVGEDGDERIRYFIEVDAPASTRESIHRALDLAGAWDGAEWGDWEETEQELERIRHESVPTPPIQDL